MVNSIWDHPRRCGAFKGGYSTICDQEGSSPQVRGIFEIPKSRYREVGIIPAGAGHLRGVKAPKLRVWDHPRRCGAFSRRLPASISKIGSSPQVRGISIAARNQVWREGIIPAGAGHLVVASSFVYVAEDHPRRCGAFP